MEATIAHPRAGPAGEGAQRGRKAVLAGCRSEAQEGERLSDQPLPPGQHVPRDRPALHYGPVPRFRAHRWDLRVYGFTQSLGEFRWTWPEFDALPQIGRASCRERV